MFRKKILSLFFISLFSCACAQDTVYARKVIRYLCSEKCFGRGYLKNGLHNAEKFIVEEINQSQLVPLFENGFTQSFNHNVNTFPNKCAVNLNGRKLISGKNFIVNPQSKGIKGRFKLIKVDSSHYISSTDKEKLSIVIKKKLTFSVSNSAKNFSEIELISSSLKEEPKSIEINIQNKILTQFKSKNISGFLKGTSQSDSLIIFSAHYDHLGGMGKNTFFPGANDNASGVSVLLNLIRFYKVHPPKYKTVFIFFAGEEAGLLGSKFFVESKAIDLGKIKFLINLDLLGTGDEGIMVVNGAIHQKEFDKLNSINEKLGLVKQIKKRGKAANSDHYWFSEAGVSCFFIYTMGGITAYHDVFDVEKTLPLTDYLDVIKLISEFVNTF